MIDDVKQSPLYPLANPRSVAFFGSSNNFTRMGTNILNSLITMGFEGEIWPVHPTEETVQGFKAYKSAQDLPGAADMAVLVVPTGIVNDILRDCGEKGIKRAVVVSGGFKEVGGDGPARQEELEEICRQYGIRIMGPNCLGVANTHHKLNTTFIPFEGSPGYIGLASQSGSFVTQMFAYLDRRRMGFSTAFSVGNEANVDMVDCLEYLGACPHTKVIALYIEGLRRGREFAAMAKKIAVKKPIVAFYIGGSAIGRQAAFSHTAALAGPDGLYTGMFRQCGIIRARTISELFDYCLALGNLPSPKSNRVVIQTHSGGPGVAAADACGRYGLVLPPLAQETREGLSDFVPHTGSVANPVDLTYTKDPAEFYVQIPRVLLKDKNTDSLMVYYMLSQAVMRRTLTGFGVAKEQLDEELAKVLEYFADLAINLLKETDKPIIGFTWSSMEDRFFLKLLDNGLPVYDDPERAARALASLVEYSRLKEKLQAGGEG